ncbi:MAG: hypothetical protein ACFB0B_05630 [Thermonemataceae bacterium]
MSWAQELYRKQGFKISNIKIQPNQFNNDELTLIIQFDSKFRHVINNIRQSRYKFHIDLKDEQGRTVYQDTTNNVATLATENFEEPGTAFTEGLRIQIPYRKMQLEAGEHAVVAQFHARTGEYENPQRFPIIAKQAYTIIIPKNKEIPYADQEFTIPEMTMENEEILRVRGAKIRFDLEAAQAYYDIANPKDISNSGEFQIYVLLKDSLGNTVYHPPARRTMYEVQRKTVKPHPNPRKGNRIVEYMEFFIPYEKINMPAGAIHPIVEVYASNYDSTFVFPRIKAQQMLLVKPFNQPYESQTFDFTEWQTKDQQQQFGVNGFRVDFNCEIAFGGNDIAGSETDRNMGYYCLFATLENDRGAVVYRAPLVPKGSQRSKMHFAYLNPKKNELVHEDRLFIPYKDIDAPEGEQTLVLKLHACDYLGNHVIRDLKVDTIQINQPPTYFSKVRTEAVAVKPASEWDEKDPEISIAKSYLKQKGPVAPDALWRIWVGRELVYESAKRRNARELKEEETVFRTADGDSVTFAVHDDTFMSYGQSIGTFQLANSPGASQQTFRNLNKGALDGGILHFSEVPLPQVRRNLLTVNTQQQWENTSGVLVDFAYRVTDFPTEGSLIVKPHLIRNNQPLPLEQVWLKSGKATQNYKKELVVEEAAQTLTWLIPHYAIQEGDQVAAWFSYDQYDLDFGAVYDTTNLMLPEGLEDIQLKKPAITLDRRDGLMCLRIDCSYKIPTFYYKDLGKRIAVSYQLTAGEGNVLNDLVLSDSREVGKLRPDKPEGTWYLYVPLHTLEQYAQNEQNDHYENLTYQLKLQIEDLQHGVQAFDLDLPKEKLKQITWRVESYERSKIIYRYGYWTFAIGDRILHTSELQKLGANEPWQTDATAAARVHPKDRLEVAFWEATDKEGDVRRVATWRGTLEDLKKNSGTVKLKGDNLKKGVIEFVVGN